MPYKCINCDEVRQSKNELQCNCSNPKFLPCPTIHYIAQDAPGRIVSTRQVTVRLPNQETTTETATLRLACNTKQHNPLNSFLVSQITCPTCIEFADSLGLFDEPSIIGVDE